jgi:hypothetical protein
MACYVGAKRYEIKSLENGSLHMERRAVRMIDTNARTANGMGVVRGPSLRNWLVRHLGESEARIRADEPAGVACAAETRDELNGLEPRLRDPGATPVRWVRLV